MANKKNIKGGLSKCNSYDSLNLKLEGVKQCSVSLNDKYLILEERQSCLIRWVEETKIVIKESTKEITQEIFKLKEEVRAMQCPYKNDIEELIEEKQKRSGSIKTWLLLPVLLSVCISIATFIFAIHQYFKKG